MTVESGAKPHVSVDPGAVWRSDKASGFAWRAKCLGADADPAVAAMLAQIDAETTALDDMWAQQQALGGGAPWWADGEYDDAEADRQNDAGATAQKQGRFSDAFDSFTEAIRLCPRKAAYHANRAAAALRLQRADIALADAANAVQRDPAHARAHRRGGQAALKLRRPEEALRHFQAILRSDAASAATAKAGIAAAERLAAELCAERQQQAAAAHVGARAPLPDEAPTMADAAEALLAADAMLAANPDLQAARAAHVEVLILARRFAAAVAGLEGLSCGPDRVYLAAEAVWRQGDLSEALRLLKGGGGGGDGGNSVFCARSSAGGSGSGGGCSGGAGGDDCNSAHRDGCRARAGSECGGGGADGKCEQLRARLRSLATALQQADNAYKDGVYQDCADACHSLLAAIAGRGAAGLEAVVLRLRARALLQRRQLPPALEDLDAALRVQPQDVATLDLQAEVLQEAGEFQEALLKLQAVMAAAPATPGLLQRLQAASAQALCHRGGATAPFKAAGLEGTHYAALAIDAGADAAAVRRAYRRQAGIWHPDKWRHAAAAEQEAAAARFLAVQAAHETLGDAQKRAVYDARQFC